MSIQGISQANTAYLTKIKNNGANNVDNFKKTLEPAQDTVVITKSDSAKESQKKNYKKIFAFSALALGAAIVTAGIVFKGKNVENLQEVFEPDDIEKSAEAVLESVQEMSDEEQKIFDKCKEIIENMYAVAQKGKENGYKADYKDGKMILFFELSGENRTLKSVTQRNTPEFEIIRADFSNDKIKRIRIKNYNNTGESISIMPEMENTFIIKKGQQKCKDSNDYVGGKLYKFKNGTIVA